MDEMDRIAESHGFKPIATTAGVVYGLIFTDDAIVEGESKPVETHMRFVNNFKWLYGNFLLYDQRKLQFVLWTYFAFLESEEIPISLIGLRNYFDYGLESKLKDRFVDYSLIFGPHWFYLYQGSMFEESVKNKHLYVSNPLIGSAINIRSERLDDLLTVNMKIKQAILKECPLPIIFGFPDQIAHGLKDYVYDEEYKKWYYINLSDKENLDISLIDVVNCKEDTINLLQHRYSESSVVPVQLDKENLWINFKGNGNEFRSRRKLSRMSIIVG